MSVATATRPRALVWLRRDLRLDDNPALRAALTDGYDPIPVYLHAPEEESPHSPGAASRSWLQLSLAALDRDLRARGSILVIRHGPTEPLLRSLLTESAASAVYWSRLYDPAIVARDRGIKESLKSAGVHARSVAGSLYFEPWQIRNGSGEPYRVFTPFWRKCLAEMQPSQPWTCPRQLPGHNLAGLTPEQLSLRPNIPWDQGFYSCWTPGEQGAQLALERFIESALESYAAGRDLPDRVGTSRLSPHLHFGEISVGQISHRLEHGLGPGQRALAAPFVRELGWREFSHHLLFHFPHTAHAPMQPQFAQFPWAEPDPQLLAAWQRGNTGVPIVDAGMRELWQTGWMHNRVRMIVASFLTKNLRYHWLHGADWFWDTLVDADLANNTQGWQWTAGCGADAAPYFRVFNPVSQGERFDPKGDYVRRYVPELAAVDARHVHQPWSAGGVRGYPAPIVDLKASREAALAAYAALRGADLR